MIGDGNCFFRAVSVGLYGNEEQHIKIREQVVKEIDQNRTRYEPLTDNIDRHIKEMKHHDGRKTSYGTEAEALATCFAFDIDVYILDSRNDKHEWTKYRNQDMCSHEKNYVCLLYSHRKEHYDFLKRDVRPCKCPIQQSV